MRFILLTLSLFILSACSSNENKVFVPKVYEQSFSGNGEHWKANLNQKGTVTQINTGGNKDSYEYEANEKLVIEYKGNIRDVGKSVSFSYRSVLKEGKTTQNSDVSFIDKTYSTVGHKKGMIEGESGKEFLPINSKEDVIEVTVEWKDKSEKIILKAIE